MQRERIEAHAAAKGYVIVDWQEDLDQPGSRLERPGLQAAIEAVEAGVADGIIVAKLDRFARSLVDAVSAIQRITAAEGQLISVEDGFDSSTSMGRFARDMLIRLGELELDRIREDWAAAGSHAAAARRAATR
jgi:site-specific DNA recombinase